MSHTNQGIWQNPNWKIIRFDIPKSGSPTEIADYKKENGLEATMKEYSYCLLPESKFAPNALTNLGITVMWNILVGLNTTTFSNANSRVGVSDNNTAASPSDDITLLSTGGTNIFMQLMDVGFPIVSSQTTLWEATFDGSTANFTWQSFGVDNDAIDGAGTSTTSYGSNIALLNRFVSNQGTKPIGQTWIILLSIEQT